MRSRSRNPLLACALAGLLLPSLGCLAQRELILTSEPPGAEVRLDEQLVGRTPVSVPFLHYGKRRVTLYLDGYLSSSRVHDIRPRWYARFPFDLFSEVLLPIGWKDVRRFHTELQPGTGEIPAPDLLGVLERAESLRRAGPEGPRPLPPAALPPPTLPNGAPPPAAAGSTPEPVQKPPPPP